MEEVIIYQCDVENQTCDVYDTFIFDENFYEDRRVQFAHIMWYKLVSKQLGHEYAYMRDWHDYTDFYQKMMYQGEGVYKNGVLIMGMDELMDGISMISLDDGIYSLMQIA